MNPKQYGSVTLFFLACALFVLPRPSAAKTEVVYASYKYVMGDNDTKNDAKRLCFLEAKRRCLEKVGSYVESLTEVQDYKLTKDEIRSYTSAIVKVEVVSEKIAFEGESVAINTRVKAEVDTDHTKRELQRIAKDKGLQARIKEQQTQIESLETKIRRLQVELDSSSYEKSFQLRGERKQTLGNLDVENERLRKIILAKRVREAGRPKIVAVKTRERRLVLKYVEIGMTPNEVQSIIREITHSSKLNLKTYSKKSRAPYDGLYGIQDTGEHPVDYTWDRMHFIFVFDDYLNKAVLDRVLYNCKMSRLGNTFFSYSYLKDKHFHILNFNFAQFAQITLYYSLSNKRFSMYERSIYACGGEGEEVRSYLWGEE